jgi:hypothetical protein
MHVYDVVSECVRTCLTVVVIEPANRRNNNNNNNNNDLLVIYPQSGSSLTKLYKL